MIGTLVAAVLIVFSSVVIGRTLMLALGWKRPEWVAGAVGFAALVVVAPFLVRLPGRGLTAAVILGVITIACAVVTRRATPQRAHGEPSAGESDRPRAQHLVALCVVPAVIAVSCLPFLFNERTGVLGEGIYTNDQAAQLYWADWLADGFGPQPNAVSVGYPVGPQALAASVSEGTTVNLVDAFNGLLVAIPALTALAALSLLSALPPWRRGLAAGLTGLPYLGASFLAQSGFKETVMAMLVVALAVVLHLAGRREGEDRELPPARAVVGVIAVLGAASVFTFSIPGGAWFAIAIPVWAILTVGFGTGRIDLKRIGSAAGEHRMLLIGGAIALARAGCDRHRPRARLHREDRRGPGLKRQALLARLPGRGAGHLARGRLPRRSRRRGRRSPRDGLRGAVRAGRGHRARTAPGMGASLSTGSRSLRLCARAPARADPRRGEGALRPRADRDAGDRPLAPRPRPRPWGPVSPGGGCGVLRAGARLHLPGTPRSPGRLRRSRIRGPGGAGRAHRRRVGRLPRRRPLRGLLAARHARREPWRLRAPGRGGAPREDVAAGPRDGLRHPEPVEARQLRLRDHDRGRVCLDAAPELYGGRPRGRLRPLGADRGNALQARARRRR